MTAEELEPLAQPHSQSSIAMLLPELTRQTESDPPTSTITSPNPAQYQRDASGDFYWTYPTSSLRRLFPYTLFARLHSEAFSILLSRTTPPRRLCTAPTPTLPLPQILQPPISPTPTAPLPPPTTPGSTPATTPPPATPPTSLTPLPTQSRKKRSSYHRYAHNDVSGRTRAGKPTSAGPRPPAGPSALARLPDLTRSSTNSANDGPPAPTLPPAPAAPTTAARKTDKNTANNSNTTTKHPLMRTLETMQRNLGWAGTALQPQPPPSITSEQPFLLSLLFIANRLFF
ncbi:hypothetical protein GALMADRAFT_138107 [Galerina marginata CBS 339.88]|uniref:Uncharacterized protein n=1 Tax=Galerina marginata (strain CBS 339.88) TaxID=685588 RepID=A0A067TDK5_GALM3|nr:hypothetical protein GALMADRAFT_138107 [Galerina marginata CBS 339.88]